MRPLRDGEWLPHRAGPVLITLQCVRVNAAYRVAVCHGSTGAEVPELSRSHSTEQAARLTARFAAVVFGGGFTVAQALAGVAA